METEIRNRSQCLVVLLHAFNSRPSRLKSLRTIVEEAIPGSDIWVPQLPFGLLSLANLNSVGGMVLTGIDERWEQKMRTGEGYERIILVGHSLGGLLARKVYIAACGENAGAPFEPELGTEVHAPRIWASQVERIVLLAAMNRGFSINHHLSWRVALLSSLGMLIGNGLALFKTPVALQFRRGAAFVTQLRIQWLYMRENAAEKGVGQALTIQLLGSIDDIVSPLDNIDLITARDFVYLDVPHSGHANVINMADATAVAGGHTIGQQRAQAFRAALTSSRDQLESLKVDPADLLPGERRADVTDVIFVIHGIRDLGFWTQKLARRVKMLGKAHARVYASETSSYGYFPMLSFLLPWTRRAKVEWLMDQYTEALALYPDAEFSFVGHSQGTYLVAKALEEYPCCRFKHIVFAGSVVRTEYDWKKYLQEGRVKAILNFVASADWVVAWFPKAMEMLGFQDLGSAGHDGFKNCKGEGMYQIQFVRGKHSAALVEENWNAIARFIVEGEPGPVPESIYIQNQSALVGMTSRVAPIVWLVALALLALGGMAITEVTPTPASATAGLMLYGLLVWKILTRV